MSRLVVFIGSDLYELIYYDGTGLIDILYFTFNKVDYVQYCGFQELRDVNKEFNEFELCGTSCKPHFAFIYKQYNFCLKFEVFTEFSILFEKCIEG